MMCIQLTAVNVFIAKLCCRYDKMIGNCVKRLLPKYRQVHMLTVIHYVAFSVVLMFADV